MSSTNSNDIPNINLNDTFYDWYVISNQVIDFVNPLNVYDVIAGKGLTETRTGNPGTVEFEVATNYGIDTRLNIDGVYEVVLNFENLNFDIVEDPDLFVFQKSGTDGEIKKVLAEDMLPPNLNDDHTFRGTITVGDLIVNDGTITINNTGTNQDNAGIVVEGGITTVSFFYDTSNTAWYSSENLGLKDGKSFVSDASSGAAKFPFLATGSQGQVDLRLESDVGGNTETISMKAQWDSDNTLQISHFTNGSLTNDILQLKSSGTNGGEVIVNNTITITDVLNSTPFSQSPAIEHVPVTDSTDGFLNTFVNRVKLPKGSVAVGDVVRMGSSTLEKASLDSLLNSQSIGIVESIDGTDAIVVTSGTFSGIYGGLVTGSVYYLDPSNAGDVIEGADGTDSTIDKPIFVATSSTSGILIPDFTNLGGGTLVTGGNINDAFKTVVASDTGESIVAVGEDTLTVVGGDNVTVSVDTNGFLRIDSLADALPTTSTTSVLISQVSTPEFFQIDSYSLLGRPLNGNIDSINVNPGSIVGRLDDTDDSDNAVKALTPAEVRALLGLSSSEYIKTIDFQDAGLVSVRLFDAADSEDVVVRAGDNITFTYDTNDNALIISGAGGTNIGGGPTSLTVSLENSTTLSNISTLTFETDFAGTGTNEFLEFALRQSGSTAILSAKPTLNYLKFATNSTTISHAAGKLVKIIGTDGVNSVISSSGGGITYDISLDDDIFVNAVFRKDSTRDGLVLGGVSGGNRETVILSDVDRTALVVPGDTSYINYPITINAYDTITPYPNPNRLLTPSNSTINTQGFDNVCVSMYADVTYAGDTYSYPFRFFHLIVDHIKVENLEVTGTAIKDIAILDNITGFASATEFNNTVDGVVSMLQYNTDPTGAQGTTPATHGPLFRFNDTSAGPNQNIAYIFHPSRDFIEDTGGDSIRTNIGDSSLIVAERIYFTSVSDVDDITPSIGYSGEQGQLRINSFAAESLIKFTNTTADRQLLVGYNDVNGGLFKYSSNTTNGEEYSFILNADSEIGTSSDFIDTLTIRGANKGYKFDVTGDAFEFATNESGDDGKILYLKSINNGVATIGETFFVKPYEVGADISEDPIYTLYFVTA